ncbi:MAG: hypothetical protein JXA96_00560 [Sedimentisphaerales bacterium]|nr:hypothetical protein [Sedimentisphaerales bacterium]
MKQHSKILLLAGITLFFTLICNSQVSAQIIYVDDDASGLNDGSSWENAYVYLQDALYKAQSLLVSDDSIPETSSEEPNTTRIEIRVAQGIYTPDKGENVFIEDIYESFELLNGVTILGGFWGLGTQDSVIGTQISSFQAKNDETQTTSDERNIELYQSILSGDLLNDDSNDYDPNNLVTEQSFLDNSYHVVTASFTDDTSVLEGFTITAGNARGNNYYYEFDSTSRGGGLYIKSAIGGPVISNCTFTINAAYEGGAIYSISSDPNITNCKFIENSANYYYNISSPIGGNGGSIYNFQSNTIITNCEFTENLASNGAAIYNYNESNGVFTNCKFLCNTANFYQGGAIVNGNYSHPILNDCTFEANWAKNAGGAISNFVNSKPSITNCIFTSNSTDSKGGAIANSDSDPNLTNCIFSGNHSNNSGAFDNSHGSISYSNPIFTSCVFINNLAKKDGGVMKNYLGNIVLKNCIFSGNKAESSILSNAGGAVINAGGSLTFINCTANGNYAKDSGPFILNMPLKYSGNIEYKGNIEFLNCIIWNGENAIENLNNSTIKINYSDIQHGILAIDDPQQGLIWGNGNNDIEPQFVESGFWIDANDPNIIVEPNDPNAFWQEGDYHLKSTAGHYDPNSQTWIFDDVNSPCLDAGDPNSPSEDEPFPNGGRINMGAYGGTTQASLSQESLVTNKESDDF